MTWYAALVVVLALCGAGAAIALLQPVVLLCLRHTDAARRIAARRHAMFSAVMVAGAIAWAIKLSFAGHAPNLVAGVAMLVCAGLLVLFAFGMRPNFVGVSVGLLASGAWLIGLFAYLGIALFDDNSAATVQVDDGLVCRETVYGFAAGDSGEVMDLYRRYLFIDHLIYRQVHSDVDPSQTPPVPAPAGLRDAPARCQTLVNAARRAAAHGG